MKNDWILSVLADLRLFAHQNDLPRLAEQLDDAVMLAACEIATLPEGGKNNATGRGRVDFRAVTGESG